MLVWTLCHLEFTKYGHILGFVLFLQRLKFKMQDFFFFFNLQKQLIVVFSLDNICLQWCCFVICDFSLYIYNTSNQLKSSFCVLSRHHRHCHKWEWHDLRNNSGIRFRKWYMCSLLDLSCVVYLFLLCVLQMVLLDVLIIGGGPHALTLATLLSNPNPDSHFRPDSDLSLPLAAQSDLQTSINKPCKSKKKRRVPGIISIHCL